MGKIGELAPLLLLLILLVVYELDVEDENEDVDEDDDDPYNCCCCFGHSVGVFCKRLLVNDCSSLLILLATFGDDLFVSKSFVVTDTDTGIGRSSSTLSVSGRCFLELSVERGVV